MTNKYIGPNIHKFLEINHQTSNIPKFEVMDPLNIPEPFKHLLYHDSLMTPILEDYYHHKVKLNVIEKRFLSNGMYSRKISLSILKNNQSYPIEYAYVLFNPKQCTSNINKSVIEGKIPIGRIMLQSDLKYKVKCYKVLKFAEWDEFAPSFPHPSYGRLASIFLDNKPIIEVFELISGV